jgi:hypothetical protein
VLNEKDSHEGTVGFLSVFQHAIQTPMDVEPTERPLHLPPLAAIAPLMDLLGGTTTTDGDMVLTIGHDRHDAPPAQGPAVGVAIVAFVQAQAFGFALTVADANAIDRLQQLDDIIAVGFTQGAVERMAIGINHQMALQPFNSVLSGVADFFIGPFLDLTTLASW